MTHYMSILVTCSFAVAGNFLINVYSDMSTITECKCTHYKPTPLSVHSFNKHLSNSDYRYSMQGNTVALCALMYSVLLPIAELSSE